MKDMNHGEHEEHEEVQVLVSGTDSVDLLGATNEQAFSHRALLSFVFFAFFVVQALALGARDV
jgi:hypothetical protein